MATVAPTPQPPGNTGPQSKVVAWTSFVVDTRTSKVYSVANGGHNDYAGNEVDTLDLEADPPKWTQLLAPTPSGDLRTCQSYYADDRPTSRHSYYGVTLDAFTGPAGRIMLFGGAHWCGNGGFHQATSSYNIGSNSFTPAGTHQNMSALGVVSYTANPLNGDVYALENFRLRRWEQVRNLVVTLNPSGPADNRPPVGGETMSAMDTKRGRIVWIGSGNRDRHYYHIATNAYTEFTLTGPNVANVETVDKGALIYVEAIDLFLVRLAGAGGTVYQIHPVTFEVSPYTTFSGGSVPSTQNGPYNKFLYVPRLQGAVYVPSHTGNAWFLRLH